ncbi:MAG: N-acetylmuramoyl-L-alanine amidase [Clostridiales bacterium]|nr:N-acetylmuramoyl-L-alanine amidase [Clostridiales bacterium]
MKIFVAQGSNPLSPRAAAGAGRQKLNTAPITEQLMAILNSCSIEAVTSFASNQPHEKDEESFLSRIYEANIEGADYFIYLTTNASYSPFDTGASAVIPRMNLQAKALAEAILEGLKVFAGLQNRGITTRPWLHALQRADMPAVIIETGFSTNEGDAALIGEHPDLVARGIANGILTYLQSLSSDDDEDFFPVCPPPFYQLYPETRTGFCDLKLHVYAGKKRQPVSRADISVYQKCGDRHIMVYRGLTDKNGRAIPVELPLDCRDPQPPLFCICVRHPGYLPKNEWIEVKGEQPLYLTIVLEGKHRQKSNEDSIRAQRFW